MPRPSPAMNLAGKFVQPLEFHSKLLNGQSNHPDGFVETVAHLFSDRPQSNFFASKFRFKKFATPLQLSLKNSRPSLPRQCDPGEKRGTFALRRPLFALQSVRQCRATLG